MTKEQKADALLEAARCWQIGQSRFTVDPVSDEVLFHTNGALRGEAASAALSEVAALGYDIANADGCECEKVAVMAYNAGSGLAWRSYLCDGIKSKVRK